MKHLQNLTEVSAWLSTLGAAALKTDSRQIQADDVFVAWPGAAVDGRGFAAQALACGAKGVLVEAEGAIHTEGCATFLGLKAASGHIAAQFYDKPSHQLDIIAFTGTNGKTSSSWWLAQALAHLPEHLRQPCAVVGTLGTGMIGSIESNGLTTPDPVLLQARLKSFVDAGCKAVALEASSIGIAEGRLNGTRIHTAVFTNFTQDHLDYHGSMEVYWQAKAALFDWPDLKAAVINVDDPQGLVLMDRLTGKAADTDAASAPAIWTIAIDRPASVRAKNIQTTALGLAFWVCEGDESHLLQTNLVGRYNVSNLLGVIASMRSMGVPLTACLLACGQITPVPGRLEVVVGVPSAAGSLAPSTSLTTPLVVVDYAHTPDALEKTLLALREMTRVRGGRLWCIFGCGGNRDASKRPVMGATARRFADAIVVTSDNPRDENPSVIVAQILLGTGEDVAVQVQVDRALAINETISQAAQNDVIVIAGKGHEDYQEVAGTRHPFSDQTHARAALAAWRAAT